MTDAEILQRLGIAGVTALGLLRDLQLRPDSRLDVGAGRVLARALISEGCTAEAFELTCECLSMHREDREIEYLRALALDRGGNTRLASEYLRRLLEHDLPAALLVDALSLAGKVEKRHSLEFEEDKHRRESAARSADWYERAYAISRSYYPGINAAAMRLMAGDQAGGEIRARELLAIFSESGVTSSDYWLLATLGEAELIAGRPTRALHWYRKAVQLADGRTGDIASMRFDLKMLATRLPVDPTLLELFDPGRVIAFAGHMIDRPGRAVPRFPADAETLFRVAQAIDDQIVRLNAWVGYSSVACGSDILFAKAMLARGRETHVVLPFSLQDFYRTSVEYGQEGAGKWRAECDFVLANAKVHYATKEPYLQDEALWAFSNAVTQGLALTRAATMEAEAFALVVLDSSAPGAAGGTRSFVDAWGARPRCTIEIAAVRAGSPPAAPIGRLESPPPPSRRQVKAMLFADVKNFSMLEDDKADTFFSVFPSEVADLLKSSARTEFQNTWGDGLFLVFDKVTDCANFALRLLDRMTAFDFEAVGLPKDTTVRVGVHAGPVFSQHDPIIDRINFFGSHVNRTARIEPVTTPGCAFASEQFAALLAVEGESEFACEYMGIKTLPKGFDRCALYRVARRPGQSAPGGTAVPGPPPSD